MLVWQGLFLIVAQPLFLASPVQTFAALGRIIAQKASWLRIGNSAARIFAGYLFAQCLGIALAGIAYAVPLLRELLHPAMTFLKSIPMASIIVLLLAWFSSSGISLFISAFVVFPLVYFTTLGALTRVDEGILEMARLHRAPRYKRLRYIYVPAVLAEAPGMLASTIGMGVRAAIAAELIGVPDGTIGEAIYKAKLYLDIADLFAWTILAVLLCFALEKGLRRLLGGLERKAIG